MDGKRGMEIDDVEVNQGVSMIDSKIPELVMEMVWRHLDTSERCKAIESCKVFYDQCCRMEKGIWCVKLTREVMRMLFCAYFSTVSKKTFSRC